jgi:protein-disulfide isomerase
VTIVEFCSFEGAFCRRLSATLQELVLEHQDDVRLVWKDAPELYQRRGRVAALYGRSLYEQNGNEAFWSVQAKLHEALPELGEPIAQGLQQLLGLPLAVEPSQAVKDKVKQSQSLAVALSITATPQLFINGKRLVATFPSACWKHSFVKNWLEWTASPRIKDRGYTVEAFAELVRRTRSQSRP